MEIPEPRWTNANEFHEFAEALAIPTTSVLTVANPVRLDEWIVLYTIGDPPDLPAEEWDDPYAVTLRRDDDDILRIVGTPKRVSGYWRRLKELMEDQIDEG
jgi:hypothetical protein